jgi:hypothetical protein
MSRYGGKCGILIFHRLTTISAIESKYPCPKGRFAGHGAALAVNWLVNILHVSKPNADGREFGKWRYFDNSYRYHVLNALRRGKSYWLLSWPFGNGIEDENSANGRLPVDHWRGGYSWWPTFPCGLGCAQNESGRNVKLAVISDLAFFSG